jgi:transposase-like protein
MRRRQQDIEKERQWRQIIHEAAHSGLSTREFCRRHDLKESQFYWWQHKLSENQRPLQSQRASNGKKASFALVSNNATASDAGIELVLQDGRRLRISRGVDEQTLRAVLAAVEAERC